MSITEWNGLTVSQISTYSWDKASVDYGKHKSVSQKLKEAMLDILEGKYKWQLINNSLKTANRICTVAGYDVEVFVHEISSMVCCSGK